MSIRGVYARWRYRLVPDHIVGEILSKNWIDNAIPVLILVIVVSLFGFLIPGFLNIASLVSLLRQLGEYLFLALGMVLVIKAGGIDLSIGSVFALCNFAALAMVNVFGLPLIVVIPAVLILGGLIGLINGVLIGYLRLRAFLTTLVSLIAIRAVVELLTIKYAVVVSAPNVEAEMWDYLGYANVLGLPVSLVIAAIVGVIAHIVLTRMRFGWQLSAVGGSRRSAYNLGMPVKRVICTTYILSGVLAGASAIFYAARLGSTSGSVGIGLEIVILTAAVLGGNSLGGGRGSVAKAVIGTIIIVLIANGVIRMSLRTGASDLILGFVLLAAVAIDVRWMKNRLKVLNRAYVSPTFFSLPPMPATLPGSGSPYEENEALGSAEPIGKGQLDGPEDIILDNQDNIYCGSRHGDVMRLLAPDYKKIEVYCHIGGHPLGMAWNPEGELVVCVAGMGLYKVTKDRVPVKLTDETNRSIWSVIDDSRMRLADDLDIAPDGKIYFSEATIRYDTQEWMIDALEARGNGRMICFDPATGSTRTLIKNLQFPNGTCVTHDNESFLFAETWGCRINRYWIAGPKAGQLEVVISDLPGYPDNINRASDGNFWVGLVGMRSPAFDLALRKPGFRRRMVYRVARDEWLYPNLNTGCVVKFDLQGQIMEALWDIEGKSHPAVTSIREHKGYLYLGGLWNNRIGRHKLSDADPKFTGPDSYWGKES